MANGVLWSNLRGSAPWFGSPRLLAKALCQYDKPTLTDNRTRLITLSSEAEYLDNLAACSSDLEEIYAHCAGVYPEFGLSRQDFREAVTGAVDKYLVDFGEKERVPSAREIRQFVGELQDLDLYLSLACARGNEQAWWEFDRQYRPFIERLARHLVGSNVDADEVIDFVYAELFGTRIAGGARQSRFKTYKGRGTLRGWLRAVVCHAVVDLYRRQHPEVPLENCSNVGDEAHEMHAPSAAVRGAEDLMLENVVRERYRSVTVAALDRSLATLDDHETLLLLYYHIDGLKLREIARIIEDPTSPMRRWFKRKSRAESKIRSSRIHESTVMRWLEKAYQKVLNGFHAALEHKHGLSAAEIELCIAIATEDLGQQVSLRRSEGLGEEEIRKGKAKRVS